MPMDEDLQRGSVMILDKPFQQLCIGQFRIFKQRSCFAKMLDDAAHRTGHLSSFGGRQKPPTI
jgi:hypothetical protein